MNRHGDRLTRFEIKNEEILSLYKGTGGWTVLNGEYLNKNKRDETGKSFNHKLILFDILVNDQYLTTVDWKGGITSRFYDIEYPLPIIESNQNIKITILANHGKTAGRVFGVRILKN